MPELIGSYLRRIEWDEHGLARRPYPFTRTCTLQQPKVIVKRTLLHSGSHSTARCRRWRKWSGSRNGKGNYSARHQSILSQLLRPPVKGSHRKLIRWRALMFLSIGWLIFYINTITTNSSAVLSPPLILFSWFSAAMFVLLLVLFLTHNQSTYKRRYRQWERSFLCQRCGTLTEWE